MILDSNIHFFPSRLKLFVDNIQQGMVVSYQLNVDLDENLIKCQWTQIKKTDEGDYFSYKTFKYTGYVRDIGYSEQPAYDINPDYTATPNPKKGPVKVLDLHMVPETESFVSEKKRMKEEALNQ